MTKEEAVRVLEDQLTHIEVVKRLPRFSAEFEKWKRDTRVVIENVFGMSGKHVSDFMGISFHLGVTSNLTTDADRQDAFYRGLESARSVLSSMMDEVRKFWDDAVTQTQPIPGEPKSSALPERITLMWLFRNVPMSWWFVGVGVVATIFITGLRLALIPSVASVVCPVFGVEYRQVVKSVPSFGEFPETLPQGTPDELLSAIDKMPPDRRAEYIKSKLLGRWVSWSIVIRSSAVINEGTSKAAAEIVPKTLRDERGDVVNIYLSSDWIATVQRRRLGDSLHIEGLLVDATAEKLVVFHGRIE